MPQFSSHLSSAVLGVSNILHLQQFHAQLIQHALHRHDYWVARLIAFCTRFHAPSDYTRIFDSTHQPGVMVFTNMLRYYSKCGGNSEILTLFEEMQRCGLKPDECVYPVLIKAAGKGGVLFHSQFVKMGLDCGKYIRNALINAYGKYGPIEAGRQLFDEMTERSVADWNAIILGYWNWGSEGEAKRLFDLMPDKNVITWTTMVSGYSKMKDLENARSYFDRMPEKSVVSWNALLSGYAQNGFSEEALSLFNEMVSTGVTPDETTLVSVISSCSSCGGPALAESVVNTLGDRGVRLNLFVKTTLLDLYAKCGRLEMAQKIFNELGVHRSSVTWNSMISAYMRTGDITAARELFDQMPEKNVVSWNSMIAGYAQNGRSSLAIELFKEMIKEQIMPDEVTMASVISACGHLGALELGNWVVNFINAHHLKLSLSGLNSLIFMYSRCGSMNEAKMIFNEMETRDVVSHNALITGFAAHGNGVEALKLLEKMKDEGIKPDRITYIGVLTACSHSGMLEEGRKVFESIKAPDIDHYACIVDLLGRVGKLDEAKRVIKEMPVSPHVEVYGSLLNACRIHKRVDLGEFAANKLFELEPENAGNYILLSNMYASARKWKEVDRIRELMKTRGLMKTTDGAGWKLKRKMQAAGYIADKSNVLRDVEDEDKEEMVGTHSEKLAVAFCLLVSEPGTVIRVVKNLRICWDCHTAIKMISKLEKREIIVRDNNRFHHFKDNVCSCNDYW
ncbi:Pentatricopeptide repeat-containing protein, chloroplastic [Sesamum angolense]|uniref:Pentatricopeptide repeat-containing protein, chloroplastic n=1 Tax=Sesamum angolense TaxID=2727404 RepID=A0AAE1X7P4_9LAMI|nr:Pentatricopeptide repeat-containing protein, chloroplastic [Sesamum angolense]